MEFTEKTFKITENVSFSILMAYFDGHPIVQTKSLKLMYHGQLQEMKSGNRLYESLIPKGLESQEALNLLNYLSRLIYDENVYDVYVNNSNQSDYVSEMKEYITHNTAAGSRGRNNRFDLIEGLSTGHIIIQEELNKYRNEDFPLVIHNFDEIEVAPLFTYVHPSLAINQGTTIHLCHFAFLLERLSHLSAYPEFNNQAIMSLLGNVFESNESGLTVEEINKTTYEDIIEENNKLKKSLDKEKSINTDLRKQMREQTNKINQLLERNNDQSTQINQLQETIDELYNMNLSSGVTIRSMDKKLTDVKSAVEEVHNEVSTIRVKDKKLHRTRDVLILYTSPDKPRDNELREHTPDGFTWIGTFNGQPRNFNSSVPKNRTVIFESESNRLDTFKGIFEKENIARYIHDRTKYRDILVRNDQIELLFQSITEELNRDDTFESVTNLEETLVNNNQSNAEIRLKRQLIQQYNPCLINLNRYKRRIYVNVNDELVLVEDVQNPENYEWMYRYGANGSQFGKLDLDILRTSRFTNELETRINYE